MADGLATDAYAVFEAKAPNPKLDPGISTIQNMAVIDAQIEWAYSGLDDRFFRPRRFPIIRHPVAQHEPDQ